LKKTTSGVVARQKAEEQEVVRVSRERGLLPIECELEGREPERKEAETDVTDAARVHSFQVRRILDESVRHYSGEETNREIDVKDPAPTAVVAPSSRPRLARESAAKKKMKKELVCALVL
jgi:hypothetical protein